MIEGLFWVWNVWFLGFFGVGKFCQEFLRVAWLNYGFFGVFKTIWRFVILPAWYFRNWLSLCSGNSYGSEIRHGIFRGLNFGPVILGGFVWSPWDFFGFDFCLCSIIPITWNPEYSPPPPTPGTPSWLVSSIGRVLHRPWSQRSRVWILCELEFSFKTSVLCSCKSCVIVSKLTIGTVGIFLKFVYLITGTPFLQSILQEAVGV